MHTQGLVDCKSPQVATSGIASNKYNNTCILKTAKLYTWGYIGQQSGLQSTAFFLEMNKDSAWKAVRPAL